jgi:hypothetical protein
MKRRLVNLVVNGLCVLSLLLCVAVVALWVRSYRTWDEFYSHWPTGEVTEKGWFRMRGFDATSARGRFIVIYFRQGESISTPDLLSHAANADDPDDPRVDPSADFSSRRLIPGIWVADEPLVYLLVVSDAWLAGAAAVLPAAWLIRLGRRRRLLRAGLCPRCGYDLRATPERCPECGATPAGATA